MGFRLIESRLSIGHRMHDISERGNSKTGGELGTGRIVICEEDNIVTWRLYDNPEVALH